MRAPKVVDPFFQDIPWEIIYDDAGRAIGEIFLLEFPTPRAERRKTGWKKEQSNRRVSGSLKH